LTPVFPFNHVLGKDITSFADVNPAYGLSQSISLRTPYFV